MLTFRERFPEVREVRIETNYRSTPEILNLANYAISANTKQFPKNLHAVRPAEKHSKPALICLQDAGQQANFICQRIGELQEEGIDLHEIAILYRAHFHSMELQMGDDAPPDSRSSCSAACASSSRPTSRTSPRS
ncbi:MAG: 3'-5' exonuclease [Verrucomicrobiota bacterium]